MTHVETEFQRVCKRNRLLLYIGLTLGGIILVWKTNIIDSLFAF